ncbi:MAG: bifunctional nuclease family protein [Tannerellaceae bacterium]|nr:bifunctional nuclease family protein [Tannerellaceae bacterium]
MDTRVKLRVQGLTNSQIQSGAYALILAEEKGSRRIPIIVGTTEAQSIAIALEKINPPRPLTHDLFSTFLQSFDIRLHEVFIYKFEDGIFFSELLFDNGMRRVCLDSRTSDAIAIALRVQCDIYTTEGIIRECGVVLEESSLFEDDENDDGDEDKKDKEEEDLMYDLEPDEIKDEAQLQRWLSLLKPDDIETRLQEAIENENYEYAKMYKDELHRRKTKRE